MALRGDLMTPYVHYDPEHLCAPIASTASVRLLFGLKTYLGINMEHFVTTAAFLQEAFWYYQAVYIHEMRPADGSYRHGKGVGLFKGNMYGVKGSGSYLLKGLICRLKRKAIFLLILTHAFSTNAQEWTSFHSPFSSNISSS